MKAAAASLAVMALTQLVLPCAGFHLGSAPPSLGGRRPALTATHGRRMQLRTSMALDQDKVGTFLAKGEDAKTSEPKKMRMPPLSKAMNKPSKAIAVALELSTKMPLTSSDPKEEYQLGGEKGFSQAIRAALTCGIWVRKQEGGADLETLEAVCQEQESAKGDFPGPVCVVRDGVKNLQEAAEAAAAGCKAISFDIPGVPPSEAQELVWAARGMGLESVATVSSDLIEMAVETGANMVMVEVDEDTDVKEMQELRKQVPKGVPGLVKVRCGAYDHDKIILARELKDAGWLGVVFCGALDGSPQDLDVVPFVMEEATSKKSNTVNLNFTGTNREAMAKGTMKSGGPSEAEMAEMGGVPPTAPTPAPRARPAPRPGGTPVGQDMIGLDEWM